MPKSKLLLLWNKVKLMISQYLSEWVALLGLLSAPQQSSRLALNPERAPMKEIARNDPDLRERISKEVELKVKDGYGAFWTKAQGKGIEKCESASDVSLVN
jgi:hypothetical protein